MVSPAAIALDHISVIVQEVANTARHTVIDRILIVATAALARFLGLLFTVLRRHHNLCARHVLDVHHDMVPVDGRAGGGSVHGGRGAGCGGRLGGRWWRGWGWWCRRRWGSIVVILKLHLWNKHDYQSLNCLYSLIKTTPQTEWMRVSMISLLKIYFNFWNQHACLTVNLTLVTLII